MTIPYPISAAIILNDATFVQYGGHTGSSVAAQRNAAYLMAEMAATRDLSTLMMPVIVTGTFTFNPIHMQNGLMLDYGYINRVIATYFIDFDGTIYWGQTGTSNNYVAIKDDDFGILDVNYLIGNCGCASSNSAFPYKIRVVYEAGMQTGTSTKPDYLMALTLYADLMLQEMIGYGNEAPGDIGVQRYNNQEYREERIGLLRTTFGTSARANLAHRLLTGDRLHRYAGL
jgi:hypothetical protein